MTDLMRAGPARTRRSWLLVLAISCLATAGSAQVPSPTSSIQSEPRAAPPERPSDGLPQHRRARPVATIAESKLAPPYPVDNLPEPAPTETLADAIALAYRSNPSLQARRYDLRATDENLGIALSALRPTAQLQVSGDYQRTVPGRATQADRPILDRLQSSNIVDNSLGAQLVVDQPLYTGGKATADIAAATADIQAGRAALRSTEGDLLLQTITAYLDVRRDTRALAIRQVNLGQLEATLDEVTARREAGELTRTDIAQAETQLSSARQQFNFTRQQLEQSRAAYATLVGVNPGSLAPEPPLPQMPESPDAAFDEAGQRNPELAEARYTEVASRERITAARADGRPSLSVRGTAGVLGKAVPFHLYNEDQSLTARGVLTIPLSAGGRTAALISQSLNTNSADRLRIEAARRAMVQNIANAWNQMATASRNVAVAEDQVRAGKIFYEGSFEEYRAGLRSTFDVLYAQATLRDARIALLSAEHDLYIAKAALLRHIGLLEVRSLVLGVGLYDPSAHLRAVQHRSSLPWDPADRALDRVARPLAGTRVIDQPPALPDPASVAPASLGPRSPDYVTQTPIVAQPGTIGRPVQVVPAR